LTAAGLDSTRFTPVTPQSIPPMYADSVMAWTGTYAAGPPDPIRVEAAAWHGRPVSFAITGPWTKPVSRSATTGEMGTIVFIATIVVALLSAAFVAWRNLRLGRVDRKGALTVAKMLFAASMLRWLLTAAHRPSLWEVFLLLMAVSSALCISGAVWLLYLAIEPYVRRYWPDALISFNRFTSGRFRDPLVASHVLVGLTVGMAMTIVGNLLLLASRQLDISPVENLSGFRFLYGALFSVPLFVALTNTTLILILVLLRPVLRRTWLADAAVIALFSLTGLPSTIAVADVALGTTLNFWVLRRFGLLGQAAYLITLGLRNDMPWTPASWYTTYSLLAPLVVAAICCWALYTILASREKITPAPA
jgi:hypothetical protein